VSQNQIQTQLHNITQKKPQMTKTGTSAVSQFVTFVKRYTTATLRVITKLSPLQVSQKGETGVHRAPLRKIQVFWHVTL